MKKGDKVRFLSEVGGGKVAGFQGKNIVLVTVENGLNKQNYTVTVTKTTAGQTMAVKTAKAAAK